MTHQTKKNDIKTAITTLYSFQENENGNYILHTADLNVLHDVIPDNVILKDREVIIEKETYKILSIGIEVMPANRWVEVGYGTYQGDENPYSLQAVISIKKQ